MAKLGVQAEPYEAITGNFVRMEISASAYLAKVLSMLEFEKTKRRTNVIRTEHVDGVFSERSAWSGPSRILKWLLWRNTQM